MTAPETNLPSPARRWIPAGFAWCVAAGVLWLYVSTAAPNPWWGDGCELATAAKVLGVAHPTGYPLYLVVAHGAIRLMGWLEPGRATTILNSVLLAISCGLTILLLMRAIGRRGWAEFAAAAGIAMIIAAAKTVWEHATITEVYPLTYFVCIVVISIGWTDPGARPGFARGMMLGAAAGLGALNHYSILATYPFVALVILEWSWRYGWGKRIGYILASMLCWAVMLAGYLYLPLRASANPGMNWGDPRTFDRVLWVLSGGQYRMLNREFWQAGGWHDGTIRWLDWWGDQWLPSGPTWLSAFVGLAIIAPAAAGLVLLARRRWALGLGLGIALIATFCFSVYYGISDIEAYFMPGLPAVAIGWIEAVAYIARRRALPRWAAVIPAIMALIVMIVYRPAFDKSWDDTPVRYAEALMEPLPKDAVLLTNGDNTIFAVWYYQMGLGKRHDVGVIAVSFMIFGWFESYFEAPGRPRLPVRVVDRKPTTKLDWDLDLIYNSILPCFAAGKRVFSAFSDPVLEQYFSPSKFADLPPGDDYRERTKPNAALPEPVLWELHPNPRLAEMPREQFKEILMQYYYDNLAKPPDQSRR